MKRRAGEVGGRPDCAGKPEDTVGRGDMRYGEKTWKVFASLSQTHIRLTSDHNGLIRIIEDENAEVVETVCRPGEAIRNVVFVAKLPEEKKNMYAARLGTTPQLLSMYVTNRKNFRYPPRDVILRALILREHLLTLTEVNHVLMELKRPCLFTNTWDLNENRRNYILAHAFSYAREHNSQFPGRVWSEFVDAALEFCHLAPLHGLAGTARILCADEQEILGQWASSCREILPTDYSIFRKRFRDRLPGSSTEERYTVIRRNLAKLNRTQEEWIETDIPAFFARPTSRNSRVGRMRIIEMAIAMDCTIDEANQMLQEANHALIYPRQADMQELEAIRHFRAT